MLSSTSHNHNGTNASNHNVRKNTSALLMALGLATTLSLSGIFLMSLKLEFHDEHTLSKPLFATYESFVLPSMKLPKYQKKRRARTTPRDMIKPLVAVFINEENDRHKKRKQFKRKNRKNGKNKNENNEYGHMIIKEEEDEGHIFDSSSDGDDYMPKYYAFDDDYVRSLGVPVPGCRRVSWHRYVFPNCNTFHENAMFVAEGVR